MKLLLDSHAVYWWLSGGGKLSCRARELIRDRSNTVLVSAVSIYEIELKAYRRRIDLPPRELRAALSRNQVADWQSVPIMPNTRRISIGSTATPGTGCFSPRRFSKAAAWCRLMRFSIRSPWPATGEGHREHAATAGQTQAGDRLTQFGFERVDEVGAAWSKTDFPVAAGNYAVAAEQQGIAHFAEKQADQPSSEEG